MPLPVKSVGTPPISIVQSSVHHMNGGYGGGEGCCAIAERLAAAISSAQIARMANNYESSFSSQQPSASYSGRLGTASVRRL